MADRVEVSTEGMFCKGCGYDLRGVIVAGGAGGATCPECGRAFDPADPSSYRPSLQTRTARRMAKPPAKMVLWLIGAACMGWLWSIRLPGSGMFSGLLLVPLLLAFGLIYAARLIGLLTLRARGRPEAELTRAAVVRWVMPPVMLGLLMVLTLTGAAQWMAFGVSRGSMEAEARRLAARPGPAATQGVYPHGGERWLGVVSVRWIEIEHGVTHFATGGFIDSEGWAYAPNGLPAPATAPAGATVGRYTYTPFSGDWYRFVQAF